MTPVAVGVIGYDQIGKRVADALALQSDLRLAGVHETDPLRVGVLRARGIPLASGEEQDWAASCDVVVVCRPGVAALTGKVVYGPRVVAACPLYGGAMPSPGVVQLRIPCADALAFARLLSCLPPVERLFSSCARRAGSAAEIGSASIDALEPLFDLPQEDADLAALLRPRVASVFVRHTRLPYTHSHVHHLKLDLIAPATREEIVNALRRAPRIRLAAGAAGLQDTGRLQEYDRDMLRPRGHRPEVFVWEESVEVVERRLFLTVDVDPDATVIPELIDAVRHLARPDLSPAEVSRLTDRSLSMKGTC